MDTESTSRSRKLALTGLIVFVTGAAVLNLALFRHEFIRAERLDQLTQAAGIQYCRFNVPGDTTEDNRFAFSLVLKKDGGQEQSVQSFNCMRPGSKMFYFYGMNQAKIECGILELAEEGFSGSIRNNPLQGREVLRYILLPDAPLHDFSAVFLKMEVASQKPGGEPEKWEFQLVKRGKAEKR